MNNVLFKRKTTLIVWRQQNKGKDLFEEILNDIEQNRILYVEFVFFKKCGGKRKKSRFFDPAFVPASVFKSTSLMTTFLHVTL